MSVIINGTDGVQFNDSSLQGAAASPFGLKNRIINGDMRIDQRNAGASGTATYTYTVDRWIHYFPVASKFSWQQNAGSVTPPAGFTNYMGFTVTTGYTPTSTDVFSFFQMIEGYNIADWAWGTANAKTITLSFWIRSSLTGTFGGQVLNSASNKGYGFSYTISSANTWEYKTVTITGATSGTWNSTNGNGMFLYFGLGVGSAYQAASGSWNNSDAQYAPPGAVNVVATTGATWYITGVQVEVGSTATPFERRMYGQELALCQRYYETNIDVGTAVGNNKGTPDRQVMTAFSANNVGFNISYKVNKRASPTLTAYSGSNSSGSNNQLTYYTGSGWTQATTTTLTGGVASLTTSFQYDATKTSSFTTSLSYICQPVWSADAEL